MVVVGNDGHQSSVSFTDVVREGWMIVLAELFTVIGDEFPPMSNQSHWSFTDVYRHGVIGLVSALTD